MSRDRNEKAGILTTKVYSAGRWSSQTVRAYGICSNRIFSSILEDSRYQQPKQH